MVQYGKRDRIVLLSKHLTVDWIAAGVTCLSQKQHLVSKAFLFTDISSNFTGSDDHMMQLETEVDDA